MIEARDGGVEPSRAEMILGVVVNIEVDVMVESRRW